MGDRPVSNALRALLTGTKPKERVRLTITVTREVHDIFQTMAELSGRALGRCMGDWLEDTAEGAELTAHQLASLRRSPAAAQAEFLRKAADAAAFEADLERMEDRARSGSAEPSLAAPGRGRRAPSSNTGLKSPTPGTQKGRKS